MNEIIKFNKRNLNKYLRFLDENKYGHYQIPEEYRSCIDIILKERELKVRKVIQCGYDVIKQNYFVEEELIYIEKYERSKIDFYSFEKFDDYYNYLNGDIYKNSCYYQCDFTGATIDVDEKKLLRRKSIIREKICSDIPAGVISVDEDFEKRELLKDTYRLFIERVRNCQSSEQLKAIETDYNREFEQYGYGEFAEWGIIFSFIFKNELSLGMRRMIKDYVKDLELTGNGNHLAMYGQYEYNPLSQYCTLVSTTNIIDGYLRENDDRSKNTKYRYRKRLKRLLEIIESGIEVKYKYGFDDVTHFFYEEKIYYSPLHNINLCSQFQFFDTFEEFAEYRGNDLSECDLGEAINLQVDWEKYVVNENTILPKTVFEKIEYTISKWGIKDKFYVHQEWRNEKELLAKRDFKFDHFFDFLYFLDYDLSGANLSLIDGLKNLSDIKKIQFNNAILKSDFCDKFNIPYEQKHFEEPKANLCGLEEDDSDVAMARTPIDLAMPEYADSQKKIYYVSDLHLMHRIVHAGCKSVDDAKAYLCNLAIDIVNSMEADLWEKTLLLIGGDICSDFYYYSFFIEQLKKRNANTVIILGNHELYSFPMDIKDKNIKTFDDVVNVYRQLIGEENVTFIQNEIAYIDVDMEMHIITESELLNLTDEELRNRTMDARYIIFGGLGFAGCNELFNANNGIYISNIDSPIIIDRQREIEESKKFDFLYKKVVNALRKKALIVMSHMPQRDWSNDEYESGVIHISGHSHRNYYYDDGEIRVYADNQIGYRNENINLKYLCFEKECDVFAFYKDGIYEITREEYQIFMRGKNIRMDFNREYHKLYMLKRNDVYMFILQLRENGNLMLLNGGTITSLGYNEIQYFYDHMPEQIKLVKTPLDKFTEYQTHIANEIHQIGGSGRIHGCIVDIDFFNHIYVNPIDMKITGYYATDIINKTVYSTITELLKDKCPQIYANYLRLIGEENSSLVIASKKNEVALKKQIYLDTDIYRASLDIKKMQRLQSNILSVWYGDIKKAIENL